MPFTLRGGKIFTPGCVKEVKTSFSYFLSAIKPLNVISDVRKTIQSQGVLRQ